VPEDLIKCQTFPDCYASCWLIFLPCVCFASLYARTAAKSCILNYMWDGCKFHYRRLQVVHRWSDGLGPGPEEVGQGGLKVLHLWRHSQNIHNPQRKFFFHYKLHDCRVFWAFEQLSTVIGARVPLAQSQLWSGCFGMKCLKHTRIERVEQTGFVAERL